jgi:tubulin polyglutamylase TTLL5
VNRLEDVVFSEPVVLQRYVSNPFLVDGFKFDMRIYVLVTSINPLEAFIYHEGFARLSTERYSLDQNLMDNKYIHLTNFSINRENIADRKLTLEQQLGGCKISLKMLKKRL